jgi:hypothetical protein
MMSNKEPILINFYDTNDEGGISFRNLIKYAKRIFSSRCKVDVTLRSTPPMGVTPPAHNPLYNKQSSGQVFKDDVNCFSYTTKICFMGLCYTIYTHAKGSTLH